MKNEPLRIVYFTDPVCSTCWLTEPYLHRLKSIWGNAIDIEVRMGGLLPSFTEAQKEGSILKDMEQFVALLEELEQSSGMHLDGNSWKTNPVSSSYPPSIAYHAIKKLSPEKAGPFLHTLRTMLFTENKDISRQDWLEEAAFRHQVDRDLFREKLSDGSAESAFIDDLSCKQHFGVTRFPTFIFQSTDGTEMREDQSFNSRQGDDILKHWNALVSELTGREIPSVGIAETGLQLFDQFENLTTVEFAIMNGISEEMAFQQLTDAANEGTLSQETHRGISIWRRHSGMGVIKKSRFNDKSIAIAGMGVAGLAIANGFEKAGIPYSIFDRHFNENQSGFGFLILENGLRALAALGLKTKFLKVANPLHYYSAISPDGSILNSTKLESCYAISRTEMVRILSSGLKSDSIFKNKGLQMFTETSDGVQLQFSTGETAESSFLFGCDGFHSAIRKAIMPEAILERTGGRELVCITQLPEDEFSLIEFTKVIDHEKRCNTGVVPLRNRMVIWFMQLNESVEGMVTKNAAEHHQLACEICDGYPEPIRKLIQECSKNAPIYLWQSNRMNLMPSFHKGRTVLLGDSAHPLLAFTSQGANSALEDAVVLARIFSEAGNDVRHEEMFEMFYKERKDAIASYIAQGDLLLKSFLSLGTQGADRVPLAIH
jgi:2-polyprenyl-6-methoxyphenol hydroxylase-like FAD-dependent oxidoreductase/predicted DsbA family dithiol-disulfide isomerase